jgi:hypothetical protein
MHGKSEPAGRGTGRMATKEQLRLALATQDVGDEDRFRVQKMIKEIVEATRCSQAEAELALHDASNNVDIAVSNILDNAKLDTWSHYSKKGPKGKEEREEPKKGGNRPDRRGGNKRDFQQKGGRGTENGNEGRENRQPRNKEDGETRGPRKPQERLRRDPNAKREAKKPNTEHKEEANDHWKNGPLVFNRRENIDEKDLHAVEPTIKPIAQPTPAGPLSYADVLRKTKPQPPPPVLAESPFKKLQVGSDAKQTPASPHNLANADGLHTDENDFLAETSKSPRQPSHHLDESLLHEDTPSIAFGSQPSTQKVQQSLTEQLKNDLGLVNLGAPAPSKKYHDSLHQNKASTHKAGVVEFLTSNAPATASSSDWQFGFEATPVPQNTVADDFRREPTSKTNEPTRTEILPKILNQYVQQPPQQNSQQQSYSHQQFNRNRNGANNLPFANNNYSDNFNPDLRSNNYGAPSSPPKSQPPLASQLQNNHHIFQQPAQPLYPSYPYLANMYSPVAAGFRDEISMLPFQNNIYPMNLDALMLPQMANATSAGPLQNNQGQHHQNSHQQPSVQQGLQQNSQNQQNQRNEQHYTDNLFMGKNMSIPSSQQNNGSSHNQQNSNLGNNQQQQRQSLMDNNPQGSVAPPPGFGNAPFIAQRNLFQNSFQMPFNQFPYTVMPKSK